MAKTRHVTGGIRCDKDGVVIHTRMRDTPHTVTSKSYHKPRGVPTATKVFKKTTYVGRKSAMKSRSRR